MPTPRTPEKKAYLKELQISFKLQRALDISQSEIHKSPHVYLYNQRRFKVANKPDSLLFENADEMPPFDQGRMQEIHRNAKE